MSEYKTGRLEFWHHDITAVTHEWWKSSQNRYILDFQILIYLNS